MSFKRLDPEDISISAESIVAPAWSTDQVELTSDGDVGFYIDASQISQNSGRFFYDVWHQPRSGDTLSTARVQFAVAYGHKTGLGAAPYETGYLSGNLGSKTPSSTIYGQYRNLVFGDEEVDFTFQGQTSNDIYVISIDRARYKEKLFPGTFNLKLQTGTGATAKVLHLTDNSNDINTVSFVDAGRIYDIISGSDGTKYAGSDNGYNASGGSYGKFLPDVGVIVLSGTALADTQANGGIEINTNLGQASGQTPNHDLLFDAIFAGDSFKLQSEETISSNFIFVRVRNSEFNYSTNPSNITSSGELRHDVMINSPQAYITTVGLYNDNNDLVAVAKLSRPLLKDFTKEALVRIKLDY